MGRPIHWKQNATVEELKAAYKETRGDMHKRKVWAIWQLKEGKSGVQVAQELAVEARTVYEWLRQYQEKGLSGLMPQSRPGRKPKALLEREEFQQRIREGKYASLLRIQQVLKEEYAADYSVSGTWALLERFDIGWKVGRRIHPSADMAAQEAFKKTV